MPYFHTNNRGVIKMIEILPNWIEWVFLITGMVMWVGGAATLLIMLIDSGGGDQ